MTEQTDMVRLVRLADGELAVGRNLPGRGAWLCADQPSCLDRAAKSRAFARAFRADVSAAEVERLRAKWAERARIEVRDLSPGDVGGETRGSGTQPVGPDQPVTRED